MRLTLRRPGIDRRKTAFLRITITACVIAALGSAAPHSSTRSTAILQYDQDLTHPALAQSSVEIAARDPSYRELQNFVDTLKSAVRIEDTLSNAANHFFDPKIGKGLPENFYTALYYYIGSDGFGVPGPGMRYRNALDQARSGRSDSLDWQSAIKFYDYSPASRARAYGALGHALHLLQDMGQPDHARDRPHPGSYVQDFVLTKGVFTPPLLALVSLLSSRATTAWQQGKVSYEALWTGHTPLKGGPTWTVYWPAGTDPELVASLDSAMINMALESQVAESALGLPTNGEVALGLAAVPVSAGTLAFSNELFSYWPDLASTVGRTPQELADSIRYALQTDPGFSFFDQRIPAIPTIPAPPNNTKLTSNPLTWRYLELGWNLLPRVEEYGSGLLLLFHDIVSPPPYVSEVTIRQASASCQGYCEPEVRYHRRWSDIQDGRGHLIDREFDASQIQSALTRGVPAELRVRFGPQIVEARSAAGLPPNIRASLPPDTVRPRVVVTRVVVEHSSSGGLGAPCDAGPASVPVAFESNSGEWVGHFVPDSGGTLCIEARDVDHHYQRQPAEMSGEALDANPATPVKSGWVPPYALTGYEPGADRNYAFTVTDGACKAGQPAEGAPWGQWVGHVDIRRQTTMQRFEGRYSIGHPPWPKPSTTTTITQTSKITVNSLGAGTYQGQKVTESTGQDGKSESHTDTQRGNVAGSVSWYDPSEGRARYIVQLDYDPAAGELPNRLEGAIGCGDSTFAGVLPDSGRCDQWDCLALTESHSTVSWSFQFEHVPPPAHVAICNNLPDFALARAGVEAFKEEVLDALRPLGTPSASQLYSTTSNALTAFARDYSNTLDTLITPGAQPDGLCVDLNSSWAQGPSQANTYEDQLSKLRKALERWNAFAQKTSAALAQLGEQTAVLAESVDAASGTPTAAFSIGLGKHRNGHEAARRLRVVVARIRSDGIVRFGARVE